MLGYVFWHAPQPGVEPTEYERLVTAFHEVLATEELPDFRYSATFRIGSVPWLQAEGAVYEDWYLVEHSGVLDAPNEAAVTAHRKAPHDRAAAVAGSGAGGLYRLRLGQPNPCDTRVGLWVSKLPAQTYAEFYAGMEPIVKETGAALWGRQMVLGPAPEFCLHAATDVELPRFTSRRVLMELVWCGADRA